MNKEIGTFRPPQRLLMGPGPSNVSPRVLEAMSRPTIGHLDPVFVTFMEELKQLLQYAFQTKNSITFPVSGPGSLGMETCLANLVSPGDEVLVCVNGVFGQRMVENVIRLGGINTMVVEEWGGPVRPEKVEDVLKLNPEVKVVAFVHAETSTGAATDAAAICEVAKKYGALTVCDAVTSLGGIPFYMDQWGIDAVYSGTQKCLSCPPGLSPVSFSERALNTIRERQTTVRSWFMDLKLLLGYWEGSGGRTYHHTAPINALYGLHEALLILKEEGLENSWKRHKKVHELLATGLENLGVEFVVEKNARLPQLNAIKIPEGVNDQEGRKLLLEKHGIEVGAGLGEFSGRVWRVGLMGESAREENVEKFLSAMKEILSKKC